jgi:hypothetical protein
MVLVSIYNFAPFLKEDQVHGRKGRQVEWGVGCLLVTGVESYYFPEK